MKAMTAGRCLLARDQLQELHVADGVEEVGDEEVLAEVVRAALGHADDREPRGVGGHHGARLAVLFDLGEEALLDGHVLLDDLDDPVAVGDLVHVVVKVAHLDEPDQVLVVERRGLALEELVQRASGEAVAEGAAVDVILRAGVGRDDVQHHAGDPRVGEVGGDA
jgi:hypothetical protein